MNVSIGIMLGKIGAFSDSDEEKIGTNENICKLENSIKKKFHHEVLTTV